MMHQRYIEGVLTDKIPAGWRIKAICNQHLENLKRQNTDDFPFWFDEKQVAENLEVIKSLRHTKGKQYEGKAFQVQLHQAFMWAEMLGWKNEHGFRRYITAHCEKAKKNAKSEEAAATMVLLIGFDGEKAAEGWVVATTKDQAKFVFKAAQVMSRYLRWDVPEFRNDIKIAAKFIKYADPNSVAGTESTIGILAADRDSIDGVGAHIGIVDEYHAHKTSDLYDNILTSSTHLDQPMLFSITTPGFEILGPAKELRDYGDQILEGIVVDHTHFPFTFGFDDDRESDPQEWKDPANWYKTNPMLGISINLERMIQRYETAMKKGGRAARQFKMKNLGMWLKSASDFIPHKFVEKTWLKDKRVKALLEMLRGCKAWGGADLASEHDISSLSFVIPRNPIDPFVYIIRFHILPEDILEEKDQREAANYLKWKEENFMIIHEGNTTSFPLVRELIEFVANYLNIEAIGYDPWNAAETVTLLLEEGVNMAKVTQTCPSMNKATKKLETWHRTEKLKTAHDPVYGYMMNNCTTLERNDLIKPDKKRDKKPIDGVISDVNAITLYMDPARYKAPKKSGGGLVIV